MFKSKQIQNIALLTYVVIVGVVVLSALFMEPPKASAATHKHPEKFYQDQWCNERGGKTEVVLEDLRRVDCIVDGLAIEFDFSGSLKTAEAVGQALHYARMTGLRAGIVIISPQGVDKYYESLEMDISHFGLPITLMQVVE